MLLCPCWNLNMKNFDDIGIQFHGGHTLCQLVNEFGEVCLAIVHVLELIEWASAHATKRNTKGYAYNRGGNFTLCNTRLK